MSPNSSVLTFCMGFESSLILTHLVLTTIFSTLPCPRCPAIILELVAHRLDEEGRKQNAHPLLITCNRYRITGQSGQRRKDTFTCLYSVSRLSRRKDTCTYLYSVSRLSRRKDNFTCLYSVSRFYFVYPLTGWYNAAVEDGSIPRERFIWITDLSKPFSPQ